MPKYMIQRRLSRRVVAPAMTLAGTALLAIIAFADAPPSSRPAGTSPGEGPTTQPARPKPDTRTKECANQACHVSIVNRKVMHGPAAQGKCDACHEYVEPRDHTFKLTRKPTELCGACHTLNARTHSHAPAAQGSKTADCTGCHDPHGSAQRMMLVADPTEGLCTGCHKNEGFETKKFVHGPVAGGACILCHEPHSSWQPKLLTKPPEELCRSCHAEVGKSIEQARHVHEPVKKECGKCHDPHASDYKNQLRAAPNDLCVSCHEDVKKEIASAKVVHGPLQGKDPVGCTGCHAAHVSELPKLQLAAQPDSCLNNCHDQTIKTADGRELTNMAELLKENPNQHGPIREGACTACHQPHAGERFRLLTNEYPPDFYAPFDINRYALCFNCHIPQMVQEKQGRGLTRFIKDGVNLHWLHVNKKKGRTCRACHEVHASSHDFHIRDAVPFGSSGWMLKIRFEKTETGGSCSPGCHAKTSYERGKVLPPAPTTQGESR